MGLLGVSEGLDTHGLAGGQQDDGGVTRLDELGVGLGGLTGTTVNLLLDLGKLASNVSGVAIKDGAVAVRDLSGVVEDDDLGGEVGHTGGGLVLRVGGDISSLDVLDRDVLDVEANVVSRNSLGERLVVHLHGLDLSGQHVGGEGDDHAGLDDTGLNTTHGDCSNSSDFVHILKGQSEGLVGGPGGRDDRVKGLEEGHAASLALLPLHSPSLVPSHVLGSLDHVVSDLLDEVLDLLLDLLEPGLAVRRLGRVHLVASNDELLDTEGVGEEGVLPGLAVLGDTSLELTGAGGDDENSAVSLRCTSDHVLDKVTMSGSINDGDIVLGSLEFPESDVNGDTSLTLGLQLVKDPGVFEGSLTRLGRLLLELLDSPLVNTSALVDQVTSGGRLARVDVADDDNVDMNLFLAHG